MTSTNVFNTTENTSSLPDATSSLHENTSSYPESTPMDQPLNQPLDQPLLELKRITHRYHQADSVITALDTVNLELLPHEIVCIMGPSGGGKTTLLNICGFILQPDHGKVVVDGKVPDQSSSRRARLRNQVFGYIRQDYAVIDHDKVWQNVAIPLEYRKKPIYGHKAKALWKYIRDKDYRTYHHLRWGVLGGAMNLPGRFGRYLSVKAYRISQRFMGFN